MMHQFLNTVIDFVYTVDIICNLIQITIFVKDATLQKHRARPYLTSSPVECFIKPKEIWQVDSVIGDVGKAREIRRDELEIA